MAWVAIHREKNHKWLYFLAEGFRPAHHIDPAYGKELRKAIEKGVEILVYDVKMDLEGISLNSPLPYRL